ncbi:hypothetical protein Pfo_026871 [Paulownia fortunei]|nr:hypothetical protein Pfo_026871 [Paulownia fortunei]
MSEVTQTSFQSKESIVQQVPGDLQNIQAAYRLNGTNYLKWSQLVRTFLKGKGKLSHLLGTGPKKGDPKFAAWDEEDSMVMSWLWNAMVFEISDTVMFLTTAREIWEAIKQTYSKKDDATQVYEIKVKLAAMKQGNKIIIEYANTLKNMWHELNYYQSSIKKTLIAFYPFLDSLKKPLDACSMALSGMCFGSHALSVSNNVQVHSHFWIVDSGATDHMTNSSYFFSSYRPCASNKKITIADGNLTTSDEKDDVDVLNFMPELSLSSLSPSPTTILTSVSLPNSDPNFVLPSLQNPVVISPEPQPESSPKTLLPSTNPIITKPFQALNSKEWKQAMKVEMDTLENNKIWEMVELPKGKRPMGCKWVFSVKYNADGSLERNKARLVAKETFASVAKMNIIRILLSLFDVKNAFLHGDLEEEIYMEAPPGFGDHTLFIKHSSSGGVIVIIVYVDDIIVTGNDQIEMEVLKAKLAKEFEIKDLSKLKYFLGIEVAHSKEGIFISQQKYVIDLLKETGKTGCKPMETPIEPNHKLGETADNKPVDKGMYQRHVGRLIYLSHTRPDIA